MRHTFSQLKQFKIKYAFSRVSRQLSCLISGLLLLGICIPPPAFAWNGAGHRIIATIAWKKFSPAGRQSVTRLLRQHPDYPRWARHAGKGMDVDQTAFIEASTWADDIRRDPRFYHRNESPTPTLLGFPDMQKRGHWHYADALDTREQDNLYSALLELSEQFSNPRAPTAHRAYALVWIIHLVADAHQPLHNGFRADRGGNEFALIRNKLSGGSDNLHSFWDGLPGPGKLRGTELIRTAENLMTEHRDTQSGPLDFNRWFHENLKVSQQYAYPDQQPPAALTEAFVSRAQTVAQRQLMLAGVRLARVIENSLGTSRREDPPQSRTPFQVERRAD